jgi:transketolase
MTLDELRRKSVSYRKGILSYIHQAGAGHTGGSLSCIDIINVLYNSVMDISPANWESLERDFYLQSKGHSVEALYVVLADLGFFDPSELQTGNRFQSRLVGHPTRKVPGVEHNTGGLGHGLSVSVGLALAAKLGGRGSRVFCLLGDGELAEGSNWEAAMSGAHYRLDNLVAIVDRNRLQISGPTARVNEPEPLADKWSAFGWEVRRSDGNDIPGLVETLGTLPFAPGKPGVLIAETVKGKGVSFIEGRPEWHHRVPSRDEYERAMGELEVRP